MSVQWALELYKISNSWDKLEFITLKSIGVKKLSLLGRLSSEDRLQLSRGDSITFPDGQVYTAEELKQKTVSEIEAALKPKERIIKNLERENKELEEFYKKQIATLNEEIGGMRDGAILKRKKQQIEELEKRLAGFVEVPEEFETQVKAINAEILSGILKWQCLVDRKLPSRYVTAFQGMLSNFHDSLNAISNLMMSHTNDED
jgi:phage host-nuclease inhibitor protein Gam